MELNDNFLEIPFHASNLDRYIVRTSILRALNNNLGRFNGKFLDIGCGKMPYKSYILGNSNVTDYVGIDIDSALEYDKGIKPDLYWDGKVIPIKEGIYNCAMATEVMEHVPYPHVFLTEVHRVLKKDGVFFFTVPFLWNLHEVPHDEWRYTPFSLQRLLRETGFRDIEINAMGGWHRSMAQMLGLWVRRAPMSRRNRKLLSIILKPAIRFLINLDRIPASFNEGQMITGMYGIARK